MQKKKHTFAICAYKESKFLKNCIESLIPQREYSDIIMATSTPNDWIDGLAKEYNIPLYIRNGKSQIQDDWNFACDNAETEWVTVAHQDDVYDKKYSQSFLEEFERKPEAIMAFCDYHPIKHGEISTDLNSRMKRFFHFMMRFDTLSNSRFWKKSSLAFGNSISCPAVAYHKSLIEGEIFTSDLSFALDWDTFVKFAQYDAPFIYIPEFLFYYRIHGGATSAEFTRDNIRQTEEMYMFRKFWPDWLIKLGFGLYKKSYNTYKD